MVIVITSQKFYNYEMRSGMWNTMSFCHDGATLGSYYDYDYYYYIIIITEGEIFSYFTLWSISLPVWLYLKACTDHVGHITHDSHWRLWRQYLVDLVPSSPGCQGVGTIPISSVPLSRPLFVYVSSLLRLSLRWKSAGPNRSRNAGNRVDSEQVVSSLWTQPRCEKLYRLFSKPSGSQSTIMRWELKETVRGDQVWSQAKSICSNLPFIFFLPFFF